MAERSDLRTALAVAAGRGAAWASRTLGRGGGTNIAGVVARRLAPGVLQQLARRVDRGVVLIAGTNGKTTTARMLAAILEHADWRVVHNRAGANLVSGVTATLLRATLPADVAVLESDEAALPTIVAETAPRLVVLQNLFRDQLDRYGEIDTLARRWREVLGTLRAPSLILANADDPAVAAVGHGLPAPMVTFGIDDPSCASDSGAHIADSQFCRTCGARLTYTSRYYAHIGLYRCTACGLTRPAPRYRASRIVPRDDHGSDLTLELPAGPLMLTLPLPGLYNAANALAAAAAACELGVAPSVIAAALGQFSAAFGRLERVEIAGRTVLLALIKNPVGATETLRMIAASHREAVPHLLIVINDRHADGTDISWLWDAEFERLAGGVARVVVSGTRAADMALRLRYAGIDDECLVVEPDVAAALDALLAAPAGVSLVALPTYTALLDLRRVMTARGAVRPFWDD
jgi:UDP-N-acetylmuramyl tripeptide synthase